MRQTTGLLKTVFSTLAVALLSCWAAGQTLPPEVVAYADIVLYNGKVLVANDKFDIAQAVAVRDGKILAVGDTSRILSMAGPKTYKMDLQGRSVVPGFIGPHHNDLDTGAGVPAGSSPLTYINDNATHIGGDTVDQILREIKVATDRAKPGEWVFVGLVRTDAAYQLTREMVDAVTPNNPLLATYDTTAGLTNSKGLSYLPPDIKEGLFFDEKGSATGHIRGWALGVLQMEILPYPDRDRLEKMVQQTRKTYDRLLSMGETTIGGRIWGLPTTIVTELHRRGELPLRVRIVTEIARQNPQLERYLKRIGNLMGVGDAWLKIAGATSTVVDSNSGNGGMWTRIPKQKMFSYDAYGQLGQNKWALMFQEPDGWKKEFHNSVLMGLYGWNLMDMHIKGDAGKELLLDVMDEINKTVPVKGKRYGSAHGNMYPPDLNKRFAAYDAIVFVNPSNEGFENKANEDSIVYQYGADAMASLHPSRSMIDAGLKPVLEVQGTGGVPPLFKNYPRRYVGENARRVVGVDSEGGGGGARAPRNDYLFELEKLVTRKNEATGRIWGPGERVTRKEALWMGTNWASRTYGDDKILGTIEPGKLADLLVLSGDYMTVPEDKIRDLGPVSVIIDGKVGFQAPQ